MYSLLGGEAYIQAAITELAFWFNKIIKSSKPTAARVQCYRGVCVMDMKQSPSCYSHRDCAATDQMCSGDGRCVDPVLQVG